MVNPGYSSRSTVDPLGVVHQSHYLARQLRQRADDLPDMVSKTERKKAARALRATAKAIEELQESVELIEAARVKAEAEQIYLENTLALKEGDTSRLVRYRRQLT